MMKHILLLPFLIYTSQLIAQSVDSTLIKCVNTITANELKVHLVKFASDEFEGRETGKAGQKKAAEYLINFYKQNNLTAGTPGFLQSYNIKSEKPKNAELNINGVKYEFLKDFYFFSRFEQSKLNYNNQIVFAGYGITDSLYNDYNGLDVKNKIVIVLNGSPKFKKKPLGKESWRTKVETAKDLGAICLLIIDENIDSSVVKEKHRIEKPVTSLESSTEVDDRIPFLFVSKEMAYGVLDKVPLDKIEEGINVTKTPQSFSKPITFDLNIERDKTAEKGENVIAIIPGTDLKDEYVVMSAHYDHLGIQDGKIYYGADDDGSGTVAVLELAQAFMKAAKEGKGPRRTMVFINFSGEEKGLLGSDYYSQYPVFELSKTICDLNIDMIGRLDDKHKKDPNYVYAIGSDKLSSTLHKYSEEANKEGVPITLDYTYNEPGDPNRFYYRSDHYNFAKNKIPVIFYFTGVHADYHKPTDTVDKIDFDKMEKITKLVFRTAWKLANSTERLKVDKVNNFKNSR